MLGDVKLTSPSELSDFLAPLNDKGGRGPAAAAANEANPELLGITAEQLFASDDETMTLLRRHDWSVTPLGPVRQWPAELLAAVRTVLASRVPMLIWWGPQLVQL